MTRFYDELRGSEGEWCSVNERVRHLVPRRGIIRAVHDGGQKVTVQFEDNTTMVVAYGDVELEGDEDDNRQKHNLRECWCGLDHRFSTR